MYIYGSILPAPCLAIPKAQKGILTVNNPPLVCGVVKMLYGSYVLFLNTHVHIKQVRYTMKVAILDESNMLEVI